MEDRGRLVWLELGPGPEMELNRASGRVVGFGCPVKDFGLYPKKKRKLRDGFQYDQMSTSRGSGYREANKLRPR